MSRLLQLIQNYLFPSVPPTPSAKMPPSSVTNEFVMNYACTIPINDIGQEPKLTASEFWRGLRRGGHDPTLFVDYVAKSEILPGSKSDTEFKRRLTMADGAVHTGSGATIDQDCRNVTGLCVSNSLFCSQLEDFHGQDFQKFQGWMINALAYRQKQPRLVVQPKAQCCSHMAGESQIAQMIFT